MKSKAPLYMLMGLALMACTFLQGFNALRALSFVTVGDVFLFGAAGLWLIQSLANRREKMLRPGLLFVGAIALFTAALGLAYHGNIAANIAEYVKLMLGLFLTVYLYADAIVTEGRLRTLMGLFVLSACINALIGLTEFGGLGIAEALNAAPLQGADDGYYILGRARGLTLHPNFLGQICALALPLMWGLRKSDFVQMLGCGLLFVGVVASGSRAALLASLLSLAVILYLTTGLRQKVMLAAMLPVAAIALFLIAQDPTVAEYLSIIVALQRLLDGLSGDSGVTDSDDERSGYYTDAAIDIEAHPLAGAGFEQINHAHNIYLQVFQSAGLLGGIALALYILHFYGIARRMQINRLTVGVMLSVFVFLFSGIASNSIYTRPMILPFAFLWIAGRLYRRELRGRDTTETASPPPAPLRRPAL